MSSMNDSSSSSVPKYGIVLSLIYGQIRIYLNFPIKMFAYDSAQMVSIAQPFIWRQLMLLKTELLSVNPRKRNLIITFVAIGLSVWTFSFSLTDSTSSWLGILLYREFTFIDTNIVFLLSSCTPLTFLIKYGPSLTYNGMFCTCDYK